MGLKEKIKEIRKSAVTEMSEVIDTNGDIRTIKNGDKLYTVEKKEHVEKEVDFYIEVYDYYHGPDEVDYTPTSANIDSILFEVSDKAGHLKIEIEKRDITFCGDEKLTPCLIHFGSHGIIDHQSIFYPRSLYDGKDEYKIYDGGTLNLPLDDNTDIHDINSVRYQLGKFAPAKDEDRHLIFKPASAAKAQWAIAKRMIDFIDKFVIVTPEEKKAYKEYAERMDETARKEREEREKLEKQRKNNPENKGARVAYGQFMKRLKGK